MDCLNSEINQDYSNMRNKENILDFVGLKSAEIYLWNENFLLPNCLLEQLQTKHTMKMVYNEKQKYLAGKEISEQEKVHT